MQSIPSSFCKDLHTKYYLIEREAIITSMNLYEFSQANNGKIGVYIDRKQIRISDELIVRVEKAEPKKKQEVKSSVNAKNGQGFCIRTGVPIVFNI